MARIPPLRRGGADEVRGGGGVFILCFMYEIFNQSKYKERRKNLRKNLTDAERRLWYYLKSKRFSVKFRRQHGIGNYIADFYCKDKNLVIELDGSQHLDAKEYDRERDRYFESLGIIVLRFWNNEILQNINDVLMKIDSIVKTPLRPTGTSPSQGRNPNSRFRT